MLAGKIPDSSTLVENKVKTNIINGMKTKQNKTKKASGFRSYATTRMLSFLLPNF